MCPETKMSINFQIVGIYGRVELQKNKEVQTYDLTLRAGSETEIYLTSGERLCDLDVHFGLSSKWETAHDIDRDLSQEDIGFLCHSPVCKSEENPFLHGGVIWLSSKLPEALFVDGVAGCVVLTLDTSPFVVKSGFSYIWGTGRESMIHLSAISISYKR